MSYPNAINACVLICACSYACSSSRRYVQWLYQLAFFTPGKSPSNAAIRNGY
jgi:hypothetical protein